MGRPKSNKTNSGSSQRGQSRKGNRKKKLIVKIKPKKASTSVKHEEEKDYCTYTVPKSKFQKWAPLKESTFRYMKDIITFSVSMLLEKERTTQSNTMEVMALLQKRIESVMKLVKAPVATVDYYKVDTVLSQQAEVFNKLQAKSNWLSQVLKEEESKLQQLEMKLEERSSSDQEVTQ
ncbi:uncharacterized protein LOC143240883 [Tachypleus tridentatus]|uniref:uncharacterized protein LOC143240883 n=1 Tax=Tachypleus tridentatus TaxID=6853 RepID=UPI003FD08798